jgi:hypothetical protein
MEGQDIAVRESYQMRRIYLVTPKGESVAALRRTKKDSSKMILRIWLKFVTMTFLAFHT